MIIASQLHSGAEKGFFFLLGGSYCATSTKSRNVAVVFAAL